jgi:Bax protein
MVKIRTILLAAISMVLFSSYAMAYQYGYYSPYPYARAIYPDVHTAYRPYRANYRYPAPPVYVRSRMPAQAPAAIHPDLEAPVQALDNSVQTENRNSTDTDERFSGLSGKKQAFIATLLPVIEKENRRLLALRQQLVGMSSRLERNHVLSVSEQQMIKKLANKYRVNADPVLDSAARQELLRKIDIIPSSLALAQAANESAWGESRFAQEANNLFGIWTYDETRGLKPLKREQGKTHLIRIFDDVEQSVRYYMYTLNSHPAYQKLRLIRQQLRSSGQVIDGHRLADGLEKYSAKGHSYVDLIRSLIRQNELVHLDSNNRQASVSTCRSSCAESS